MLFDSPLKKYFPCAITIAWLGEKTEIQRTMLQDHWNLKDLGFYTYNIRLVWILQQEFVYKTSGFCVAPDVLFIDTMRLAFSLKGEVFGFCKGPR